MVAVSFRNVLTQVGMARDLLSHRNLRTTPQATTIEQERSSQSAYALPIA